MNELLQKHGCSNVFSVPDGLKELMSDISREVLREQPSNICDFIANYLSALIISREHGILATKILEDLCDCRPSVTKCLMHLGLDEEEATKLAKIIKEEVEGFQPIDEKDNIKEAHIVERILNKIQLDEAMAAQVCQIARNAYRDYRLRRKDLKKVISYPDEPWEIAAQRTLEIYKKTKPTLEELSRAAERIQAAYRGYYVRRNLLPHLNPRPKKELKRKPAPVDVSGSRQIEFGPIINVSVQQDNIEALFDDPGEQPYFYDPGQTISSGQQGGGGSSWRLGSTPQIMMVSPMYKFGTEFKEIVTTETEDDKVIPPYEDDIPSSPVRSLNDSVYESRGLGDSPQMVSSMSKIEKDIKEIVKPGTIEFTDKPTYGINEELDKQYGDSSVEESLDGSMTDIRGPGDTPQIMTRPSMSKIEKNIIEEIGTGVEAIVPPDDINEEHDQTHDEHDNSPVESLDGSVNENQGLGDSSQLVTGSTVSKHEKDFKEIVTKETAEDNEVIPPYDVGEEPDEIPEEHGDALVEESPCVSVTDLEKTFHSLSEAAGDITDGTLDTGSIVDDISDAELLEME